MIVVTRTDVGKLRANNQDALIVEERLWGVADGMGGHKGGEVASAGARDGLKRVLHGKEPDPKMLRFAVEAVNRRLYLQQKDDPALSGMGTTLTLLWAATSVRNWTRYWSVYLCSLGRRSTAARSDATSSESLTKALNCA